jgi:hypothetical protein
VEPIDAEFEVVQPAQGAVVPSPPKRRRLSWKAWAFIVWAVIYLGGGLLFTPEGQDLTGLDNLPTIVQRAPRPPAG